MIKHVSIKLISMLQCPHPGESTSGSGHAKSLESKAIVMHCYKKEPCGFHLSMDHPAALNYLL